MNPNSVRAIADDALIQAREAMRLAGGVCEMTLRRWEQEGLIPPALRIRRRRYWKRGEFLSALERAGRSA